MRVLGIETSCDDTGIAIYDTDRGLLSHTVYTQVVHTPFGGVVPELASRDHILKLLPLLQATLEKAQLTLADIDGIAFTKGPGLMGPLMVGAMFARTLAFALGKPAIGIHHLEGHLLAPFLEADKPTFPFLALLVSGGHTALIHVTAVGDYHVLGDTLDDAVGEAFDKTAKLLGLGYPGGKALAELAQHGCPGRFHFPRPMVDRPGLDFSFSGLKTFALNTVDKCDLNEQTKADIAFAFQEAVVETLVIKCCRALAATTLKTLVVAGGVGANRHLRERLTQTCMQKKIALFFPSPAFCTDNGAMIAYAGAIRLQRGECETLSLSIAPRLPL